MSGNYDAVIIGSGIGGLTCGAFLARAGRRVLVLESHSKIGGYAHSFKRRNFRFESGIHSVALAPNGLIMHLLRLLGLDREITPIPHESMFGVRTPALQFSMPAERPAIEEALARRFPAEKENIGRLFADMKRFYDTMMRPTYNYEERIDPENTAFISQYYNKSYQDYIAEFIGDPLARSVFFSQWPFAGSSPDYSPVIFNVLMFYVHLSEGSHYVQGGFAALADALAGLIVRRGGAVVPRRRVTRLVVEDGRARTVECENGETFDAPLFISNVSPYLLHNRLLDESARSRLWLRRLGNLNPSLSSVAVYLGVKHGALGSIRDAIDMVSPTDDHARVFGDIWTDASRDPRHLVVLRAPAACGEDTLTLMSFVRSSLSTDWKNEKMRFGERMLEWAERLHPGLRSAVEVMEVGSPATFERYTGNTGGALYGFENTKSLYGEAKLPVRTHLPNLYQTGHWGKPGGGVWNVMQNGYAVAKTIEYSRT